LNLLGIGSYSPAGFHCDISKSAIIALSVITIAVNSICIILIVIYIFKECRRRKKLYFVSYKAKALFPIFFLIHSFGDVIFNIVSLISNGEDAIGYNTGITVVASLLPVCFFTGLILYFRLIIGFLNGYAKMMSPASAEKVKTRFATLSYFSWYVYIYALYIDKYIYIYVYIHVCINT
jgi:hypothetical protein